MILVFIFLMATPIMNRQWVHVKELRQKQQAEIQPKRSEGHEYFRE